MKPKVFVRLTSFLGSLLFVCASYAQVTTGSISGAVTDSRGEPLAGTAVVAVHNPTGTKYSTLSDSKGNYQLPGMRIGGPYTVNFSFVGFTSGTFSNITLTLGEEYKQNAKLTEDVQTLDEITVFGAQNPVISSSRTGAQEIITREKMDKLPTFNRSLNDFTKLTPMNSGNNFGGVSYRFNNVTVDGASFNNSFGLSSSLGASGVEPVSLEALEQIQVMIAPYDVRNGGFTGAGINSVTKSGSNEFHASAYMYTKSPAFMGYRVKDKIISMSEFSNHQYGLSLSGALIKNKLFFYLNAEMDRQEKPVTYTTENSVVEASVLQDLSDFLGTRFGYNPGAFDVKKTDTQANRITARLDWNINAKNALSVKYYYLKSFNTNSPSTSGAPANGRGPNQYAIPYSSTFYRTNNNFNIFIADLNTIINDKMSNYFKVGYSRIRDFRDVDGGVFPQVDILNGGTQAYTTFGMETNSYNNQLDSDIWQLQDNFIFHLDKHQITVGTQSDYHAFVNGFAQDYLGSWVFNSVEDFKFNVLATKDYLQAHGGNISGFNITNYDPASYGFAPTVTGIANSSVTGYQSYVQKYAIGDAFPLAKVNVLRLGFYIQDKWKINDRLNVTGGLRVDIPVFLTDLPENARVAAETYRDGIKIDVSKYPGARPVLSPRLGFNYQPFEDGSLQVRGGTGLFSGTPPYVWLSNQAGNNGVLFGKLDIKDANQKKSLGFTGDLSTYKPAAGDAVRDDIAITDPDFQYPNLWKTNLAADYKFGDGWIATIELLYSKDLNAIYHDNIGLVMSDYFVNDGGAGAGNKRPFFTGQYYSDMPGNQKGANNVVMMRNTNRGYAFFGSAQLQKSFYDGPLKGLYLNLSYAIGKSESVTDGSSSVATSAWKYRPALNPNAQETGYSSGSIDGRFLATAFYTAEWSKNAATNIGLIYQIYRPFRYSYCYSGDANGDIQSMNDLIYIPRNFDEVKDHLVAGNFASQEDAWNAMDAFIAQDPYLSKHRGEYAERNGAVAPFAHQLDWSIYNDLKIFQGNGRAHTLRISFDIANFLNLLNKDWGVQQTTVLGSQQYQFLTVTQKPAAANNYTLKYNMRKDLPETFQDNISAVSRWQMVFGIKYIF
ncbi:MAG: TonB-dependent receptor [Prevotellaceae bacterium]|nr:TonB-dependent receptor [Prevotellaceae bacterium]